MLCRSVAAALITHSKSLFRLPILIVAYGLFICALSACLALVCVRLATQGLFETTD